VDTHGHTHLGLCLCKLLGFDLCPRLYDMRHQWLHVPRDWPEVPGLEPILRRDIDLDVIHAELGRRQLLLPTGSSNCRRSRAPRTPAYRGCLPKRAESSGFLWITHFVPAAIF
jgi:hypothetical protein